MPPLPEGGEFRIHSKPLGKGIKNVGAFIFFWSIIIMLLIPKGFSWGFFAHKQIHFIAIQVLPEPLIGFYKNHANFIVSNAVAPDKRRYVSEQEAARHYLDYDRYDTAKTFDVIPHNWCAATLKFSEDTLKKHGILPWQVMWSFHNLEDAFKQGDWDEVLMHSADLGHYIADAHVPLHTTRNYNGQLTHQHGIHSFWESRIPELYFELYDFWVGKAIYIENPQEKIWSVIKESHLAVDSVLLFERELSLNYPEDEKYGLVTQGKQTIKTYSDDYTYKYNELLDGMVERRLKKAVLCVASFWYSAWVNAGSPELPKIEEQNLLLGGLQKMMAKLDSAYQHNRGLGREHED